MPRRPDWIVCIVREGRLAIEGRKMWCGRDDLFALVDLNHAENCIRTGSRLVPCGRCLKKARAAAKEAATT